MKLVESAQTGTLQPERLSQILAAASLAIGQDCRSQILMQLILLIQQQLAATDANSTLTQNQTTNPSAIVPLCHDTDNASVNSNVREKSQNSNTHRKRPGDIETGNSDKENEMDKLLAWKNRIENASVTGSEEQHSSAVEVSRCMLATPASPDAPMPSHVDTARVSAASDVVTSCVLTFSHDASHGSTDNSSCVLTDVLQSVSCSTVSPASPDYPPLPTPPKPPDNLLMSVRQGSSSKLFTASWSFPPAVNSAISVTAPVSADTARLPCLSVPVSTDTSLSCAVVAQSGDCECPEVTTVSSSHNSPMIIASNAQMPLETFSHDASQGSTDNSSMNLLSVENCMSENKVWCSGVSNSTFSPLNSVQEDHGVPYSVLDIATTRSEEPHFQQRRAVRLQSPGAWMSRLASPSAFMLQSGVSRLQAAVSERPDAAFISHKLSSQLSSPAVQPTSQRHSPTTADNCRLPQHSDSFCMSQSELGGELTVDDRQARDFDNVSSDSYVPKSQEGSNAVCNSQLSACHSDVDTLRMFTDKVLMRLAGMPAVDSDACGKLNDVNSAADEPSCESASVVDRSDDVSLERRDVDEQTAVTVSADDLSASQSAAVTVPSSSQQQQADGDDLEEGEIVDDPSPTPASPQRDLPEATQQLLLFLKTNPVRNSSSSRWLQQPHVSTGETTYHHRDDRREDFYKYKRTNSDRRH